MTVINKKPLSHIREEREQQALDQMIDLYEAVAGMAEELAALQMTVSTLEGRVAQLEGGTQQ